MKSLTHATVARASRLLVVTASVAAALGGATRAAAQTTTLTFTGGPNAQSLLAGYGDRVAAASQGGYTYVGSGGFTPHVLASFGAHEQGVLRTVHPWYQGYNDLLEVIWCSIGGVPGGGGELVLTLTADPGYRVALEAFDVGNWGAALTLPYIRVRNEDGQAVFEQLNVPLQPNSSTQELNVAFGTPPIGRVLSLHIGLEGLFGQSANVGLDNVRFRESAAPTGEIGARYCAPAVSNSSAGPAALRVWGQSAVAANDVRLVATGLPLGSFGFFLASRTQGNIAQPGGSQGVLCLGGAIGRFVGAGQIVNSGFTGNVALDIDLSRLPTPTGLVAAQAGQTWNFTAWFRDANPASTSNFTDAVALVLQ